MGGNPVGKAGTSRRVFRIGASLEKAPFGLIFKASRGSMIISLNVLQSQVAARALPMLSASSSSVEQKRLLMIDADTLSCKRRAWCTRLGLSLAYLTNVEEFQLFFSRNSLQVKDLQILSLSGSCGKNGAGFQKSVYLSCYVLAMFSARPCWTPRTNEPVCSALATPDRLRVPCKFLHLLLCTGYSLERR